MHLTQSAMSVLIQQLEEALGVTLFMRTTRSLRPTQAAHETYEQAQRILADVDYLMSSAQGLAEKRRGIVHFAVATSVASTVLPGVIAAFEMRYPDVHLVVHDMGPEQLLAPVLDHSVEFSIGTPEARNNALTFTPLVRDRLAVICTPAHPFAGRDEIPWRDLPQARIITVRRGNGIRAVIDRAVQDAGIDFQPAWEVSYLASALALTAQGLGVSVLPAHLIDAGEDPRLVTRPLVEPEVTRDLYLVTSRDHVLTPGASALIEIFREKLGGNANPDATHSATDTRKNAALRRRDDEAKRRPRSRS